MKKFSEGLRKCASNFEKDMSIHNEANGKKGVEATELEFSTTSIAITGVRAGIDVLAQILEDSTCDIVGDMMEPIEEYVNLYSKDCKDSVANGKHAFDQYLESKRK